MRSRSAGHVCLRVRWNEITSEVLRPKSSKRALGTACAKVILPPKERLFGREGQLCGEAERVPGLRLERLRDRLHEVRAGEEERKTTCLKQRAFGARAI